MIRLAQRTVIVSLCLAAAAVSARAQDAETPHPLVGRLVPTFAWPSMTDSTVILSPLSLKGSLVLIDLWGTWCGPCRKEMPFLHEAYSKYKAHGFEILSVAFDESAAKVRVFRTTAFPMPWQHVLANGAIESEASRIFMVDNFPRTVLVDRDGVVLRVDSGLRGPALLATLDSVLFRRVPSTKQ